MLRSRSGGGGAAEDRRRAVVVGGSIALFIVLAAGISALIHTRWSDAPYLISFPFLGVIVAMGFELSYDILRAAQTARRLRMSEASLRESEMRMSLAAIAGKSRPLDLEHSARRDMVSKRRQNAVRLQWIRADQSRTLS